MRLLGVTIDSCLSWDAHIGQIIKKCNAILISLYRFRHHFNQETLKLLIETHVFPHILYCISVWGGAAKNQLFRIQKVINFGARIVLGVRRRDRIGPALASLGWARIEQLVREKDLLKIYKALHYQLYPLSIRRMFTPRSMVSARITRSTEPWSFKNANSRPLREGSATEPLPYGISCLRQLPSGQRSLPSVHLLGLWP